MNDDLISESHVSIVDTRNGTPFSRFCNNIVQRFLDCGAEQAVVHHERTNYTVEALYTGLRNTCRKTDYRRRVRIHKQDGCIYLIRLRKQDA